MIKELLETRIRPAVQEDGGDITFMVGICMLDPAVMLTIMQGLGMRASSPGRALQQNFLPRHGLYSGNLQQSRH